MSLFIKRFGYFILVLGLVLNSVQPLHAQTQNSFAKKAPHKIEKNKIQSAVANVFSQVFLSIRNKSLQSQNSLEFFTDITNKQIKFNLRQKKELSQLKPPQVTFLKDELILSFNDALKIIYKINYETYSVELEVRDPAQKKSGHLIEAFFPKANAMGPAIVAAVVVGTALTAARVFVLNAFKELAIQAAVGATFGCLISVSWNSGDEKVQDSCLEGAKHGSVVLLATYKFSGLLKLLKSSKVAKFFTGGALTTFLALAVDGGVEVATMDSPTLRCNGPQGDFTVNIRKEGLMGRDLYEVSGKKIVFTELVGSVENPEVKRTEVEIKSDKITQFLKEKKIFEENATDVLNESAQKIMTEIEEFRSECSKKGNGHTRRLWNSEIDNVKDPKNPESNGSTKMSEVPVSQ